MIDYNNHEILKMERYCMLFICTLNTWHSVSKLLDCEAHGNISQHDHVS